MSVPYVIEKGKNDQDKIFDIYSRLLKDRIIFIKGVFDQNMADAVTAQLLFLESSDSEKDIYLYINSPGGHVDAMFSILDVIDYVKPDICTIAYGTAASAASFILCAGTKGKRFALKNSSIMLHELSGGSDGKFHDMEISYNYSKYLYEKMARYYAQFTGKPLKKIKRDMLKDFYLSSDEAVEYGIIDKVQNKRN